MDLQQLPEGAGTISTIIGSVLGTVLFMRKKLSKDTVDVRSDDAQINMLIVLQEERDEYRKLFQEAANARLADTKLIGELTAKLEQQSHVMQEMSHKVDGMRSELHALRDKMQTVMAENDTLRRAASA